MARTGTILAMFTLAAMALAAVGCEERVIRSDYRPVTGMAPQGDYQYKPLPRNNGQQEHSWWDDLFGDDEPQSGTTRNYKPVWDQYGNPNTIGGTTSK